MKLKESGKVYF